VIFLKRFICFILFLFFVLWAKAEVTIPEDFYTNNGEIFGKDAIVAENVLPETLLVCIEEGECRELYADLIPRNTTERKLVWSVDNGYSSISISPGKEGCTLMGKKAGNAKITVTAPGGASAEISVEVRPVKKIVKKIEEPIIPPRPPPQKFDGKMARNFAAKLIVASGAMFLLAGILIITGRRNREKK